MTKIALIHNCPFPFGGAERISSLVATMLYERGFEVWVFCTEVDTDRLSPQELESIRFETCRPFTSQREFAQQVVDFDTRHHFDVIAVLSSLLKGIPTIARHSPARLIYFHHNTLFWEERNKISALRSQSSHSMVRRLRFWLLETVMQRTTHQIRRRYYQVYKCSDAFCVLCEGYRHRFEQTYGLDRPNRLWVIRNALSPLPAAYSADKRREVLYLGRLSYEDKRIDRLLEMWRRLQDRFPEWTLRIVGEGNDRERLMTLAEQWGLQRVEFHSFTSEPWRYYAAASIYCLTSNYEGWPLVLAEAQQAGTVPMSFNCVDGIKDIIVSSWEYGVLIPPFDLDAYTESLARLMSDDTLRRDIASRCIEKSREYVPERMADEWVEMLETLLALGPKRIRIKQ